MNSPRILLLQPGHDDPAGPLGDWLTAAGAELDTVAPPGDQVPASLDGYAGLVCLGGQMGAYDDLEHPWLAEIRKLLAAAVTARLPTLAICLGAQLLAAATGGRVRTMPDGPEAGPLLVAKRDLAAKDVLFGELPFTPDVIQFHSDEVHVLPASAEHLAASPHCTNQAFRVGPCAYGLQFHIETTPEVVLDWAAGSPSTAAGIPAHKLDRDSLTAFHAELAEVWRPFVERFVRLTTGELAIEPSVRRGLPLA